MLVATSLPISWRALLHGQCQKIPRSRRTIELEEKAPNFEAKKDEELIPVEDQEGPQAEEPQRIFDDEVPEMRRTKGPQRVRMKFRKTKRGRKQRKRKVKLKRKRSLRRDFFVWQPPFFRRRPLKSPGWSWI